MLAQDIVWCFTEIFAFVAKHSPANFPPVPSLMRLSTFLACSIAVGFSFRKMFRSFDSEVAISLEKFITFSTAESLPSLICLIFGFSVILLLSIF